MLFSLAKLAVRLDFDHLLNGQLERLYKNTLGPTGRFSRRFQILTYHKVSTDAHPFFEPIHPAVFEQHVQFLKRCYRVIPLSELVARSRRGDVPERAVAITFDDGYRDNYDFAFPILKKYGVAATIFVATGVIGNGENLWHDRIFDAFRFSTAERMQLNCPNFCELMLDSREARLQSLQVVIDKARTLYGTAQRRFVEEIEEKCKPDPVAESQPCMLSWEQIREMRREGIEFGSHTVTHPILSRIPHDEMLKEITESKQQLFEQLGDSVALFAYPNGKASDYNNAVKAALRECGYVCAVTTERGFNPVYADPYELKRGQPWQTSIESFRLSFFLERHGF
jgi:peptidoglycan/xylan/chitin deacetylase (PgdA/CDA1 family)